MYIISSGRRVEVCFFLCVLFCPRRPFVYFRMSPNAISESGGLRLKCGTTMSALKSWPPNQTADQIVASQSSRRDKNFINGRTLRTLFRTRESLRQNVVEACE